MPVIDADTHIHETEDTWAYMEKSEVQWRPATQYPHGVDPALATNRYWLIDGKRQNRGVRNEEKTGTRVEADELLDIDVRLGHMDRLGVDVHIIYPTLFLLEFTDRPEVELALRRSYNRWMADRCEKSGGRLRWVCVPPLKTMDKALEEVRWAKEHGAIGALKKGGLEAGSWFADPYFFPFYEELERLDMPVCVHIGSGVPDFTSAARVALSRFHRVGLTVAHAFHSVLLHGLAKQFPGVRWGFVEAASGWVPYALYDLTRRMDRRAPFEERIARPLHEVYPNLLVDNNIFVTCQVDEDIPYILKFTGEESLMIGSDYTHADASGELLYKKFMQQRVDQGDFSAVAARKIMEDNPKRFYGV